MTRVIMKTLYAGPKGTFSSGAEVDLPEKEAKALVAGRYADYASTIEKKAREKKAKKARQEDTEMEGAENAMAAPPSETADARPSFRLGPKGDSK